MSFEIAAKGQWVESSTEAITIRLVKSATAYDGDDESDDIMEFNPQFTYTIFGENEQVFGYKDLEVNLEFASGSLASCFSMGYKDKKPSADSIHGKMKEYLPRDMTDNHDMFLQTVERDAQTFRPVGTKCGEYTLSHESAQGVSFELYQAKFDTPGFKEYHRRLQTFLTFFIEGATFIEEDDEKWEFMLIFEKDEREGSPIYSIVGYCTMYPYFYYPDQIRMRISQFLILPPFQGHGHGSKLYQELYNSFLLRKEIRELTVEDPNDEFSDLRDKNDMRYLYSQKMFEKLSAPIPREVLAKAALKYKLTKRQTARCFELALLKQLDKRNKVQQKAFRLQVKQRLYKHNAEALSTLTRHERIEKLDDTFRSVEEDYIRILALL